MKHLLFVAGLICSLGVQAQLTSISVETYQVHDGTSISELAGFTTYHVYANTLNSSDFVSAVFGDSDNALSFSSTGSVFNSAPGFVYGNEPNTALFVAFPSLEYDSWMTIGMMNASDGGSISNVGMNSSMESFNATGSFYIDDPIGGSWFYPGFPCGPTPVEECSNNYSAFGGSDNKVLLAQITTDGSFTGVFNVQIFVEGVQTNTVNYNGYGFSTDSSDVFGCTDELASNYNDVATVDDLSCVLPCTLQLVVESAIAPTCFGENNGSLVITSTGAQGSDDYYFGVDDEVESNFGNFNSLIAGDYYVEVVDGAGCTADSMVTVPVTPEVTLTATLSDAISCFDMGDATIEISNAMGGSGDLGFYLSGFPENVSSSMIFSDLGAGTYTVVAVDANGCMGSSLPTSITNPSEVNVQITNSSPASCAEISDGVITCASWGGAAPSTLTYTVDGVSGLTSPLYISAGTYSVVAIDVNGCFATSDDVVVGPDVINVNSMSTSVACVDDTNGSISWAPSGGVGSFSVMVADSMMVGSSMMGLAPGVYSVFVTDGNGCTSNEDVEVMNATPIEASSMVSSASCNGLSDAAVVISASGGTGSFQYSDNGNSFVDEAEFNDLSAGDYTFYAQDENGCVSEIDASVTEPEAIVITGIASEGEDTGNAVIDLSVTGGTPDYAYEWSGPGVDGTTSADLDGLSSGTYDVQVTDSEGCSTSATFNVVTGLFEIEGGIEAQVYPNPSSGMFNISWTGFEGGDVDFSVVDALGRQITSGSWLSTGSSFDTILDLTGLENGIYQLSVVAKGVPSSIQLVIAN